MSHLLLIDGMNLVRRVYEAQNIPDSPEKARSATRSSISSFKRALREHKPSHVLAAFDHGGPTWRHALLPTYHGHRRPMPTELKEAMPEILKQVQALGVRTISVPEVEADDVIATAVKRWRAASQLNPVTIISTDKDLATLMAQGAQVWDHFGKAWRDEAWVQKKFGVTAAQLQDFLTLSGDIVDGVAGVPGVGPKTAAKWLAEYGSIAQLLERVDTVPGKIGEKLRANLDRLELARQLISFKTDVVLGLTWSALRYTGQH